MKRIWLFLPFFAAACGGNSTGPVAVAGVTISPSPTSVSVSQTVQLTATTRDAGGNVLTGRAVTWGSSDGTLATVNGSGLVTGVSTGFATITATSEGKSASADLTVFVPVTVVVTNQLIDVITVSVNGTPIGTVSASNTQQATVNVVGSLTVSYDLNRPTTTAGTPVGEQMSGVYATIQNPSPGTYPFTVNNFLGTQEYFSPLITNNGAYAILMAVNWGLVAENRCNCTAPSGGSNVNIGYYRLYSNTEIRGYGTVSGYGNGSYVYWQEATFGSGVQSGSGVVNLTNSLNIQAPPVGAPGVAGTVTKGMAYPTLSQALPNPR
ncbi:MAG TPA: Ig-like domain-containing protein [Gemmatimonadales bacterium]